MIVQLVHGLVASNFKLMYWHKTWRYNPESRAWRVLWNHHWVSLRQCEHSHKVHCRQHLKPGICYTAILPSGLHHVQETKITNNKSEEEWVWLLVSHLLNFSIWNLLVLQDHTLLTNENQSVNFDRWRETIFIL